jgi:hypothetical protein
MSSHGPSQGRFVSVEGRLAESMSARTEPTEGLRPVRHFRTTYAGMECRAIEAWNYSPAGLHLHWTLSTKSDKKSNIGICTPFPISRQLGDRLRKGKFR